MDEEEEKLLQCYAKFNEQQKNHRARRDAKMTREENLDYREKCPYDAMGDYSTLFAEDKQEENRQTGVLQTAMPAREIE